MNSMDDLARYGTIDVKYLVVSGTNVVCGYFIRGNIFAIPELISQMDDSLLGRKLYSMFNCEDRTEKIYVFDHVGDAPSGGCQSIEYVIDTLVAHHGLSVGNIYNINHGTEDDAECIKKRILIKKPEEINILQLFNERASGILLDFSESDIEKYDADILREFFSLLHSLNIFTIYDKPNTLSTYVICEDIDSSERIVDLTAEVSQSSAIIEYITAIQPIHANTTFKDVAYRFLNMPYMFDSVAVVDDERRPVGIITQLDIFKILQICCKNYGQGCLDRTVHSLMKKEFKMIKDIDNFKEIMTIIDESEDADIIVVNDVQEYVGMINRKKVIEEAYKHNDVLETYAKHPVSRIPSNLVARKQFEEWYENIDSFIFVSIEGYESVVKKYGIERGHLLMKCAASVILDSTTGLKAKPFHISDKDFIIFVEKGERRMQSICTNACKAFDEARNLIYDEEDASSGYVYVLEEEGMMMTPLATITMVIFPSNKEVTGSFEETTKVGSYYTSQMFKSAEVWGESIWKHIHGKTEE